MALIRVKVRNERGNSERSGLALDEDVVNYLYQNGTLLKDLDPVGDTIFNRFQATRLEKELLSMNWGSFSSVFEQLIEYIELAKDGNHSYLWFIGE